MNAREELHQLLDRISETRVPEVRAYLSLLAERDWDTYFASLPRGEEPLSVEEIASLDESGRTSEVPVTLTELKAEIESK